METEAQLIMQRASLRWLAQQHPTWTQQELAMTLGKSLAWVKKWLKRLREAKPTDVMVLHARSRARKTPVLAPWDIRSEKGTLRGIYWPHSACRREAEKVESESIHVFQTLVPFILFAKEKPVFPVLIPIRQRIALCFHALYGGIVRWMKPRSTSLLFGTIADLAKGKSELLVENALLRQQLIILHRQVKRPACKKTDTFLLVLLARMIRTWKQALFIVQPETLLRLPSGTLPLVLEAHVKG